MKAIIGLFALVLLVGCESTPDAAKTVCVSTAATGQSLRAVAGYTNSNLGRALDVIDDVAVTNGRGCLTLRPPKTPDFYAFYSFDYFYVDLAIYDDLNGSGAIDPGELVGRLSASPTGSIAPILRIVSESNNPRSRLESNPHAEITRIGRADFEAGIVEFPYGYGYRYGYLYDYEYGESPQADLYRQLPVSEAWWQSVEIASARGCEDDQYPACVGTYEQSTAKTVVMIEPSLSTYIQSHIRAPLLWPLVPMHAPASCLRSDNLFEAVYVLEGDERVDGCRCVTTLQVVRVFLDPQNLPDWLNCDPTIGYNPTWENGRAGWDRNTPLP